MAKFNGLKSSVNARDVVQNSIGLLVSILVRYPEVATCKLSPSDGCIKLTYILQGGVPKEVLTKFKEDLSTSLEVLYDLRGVSNIRFECCASDYAGLVLLEISRDFNSLSREEIALVTALVATRFRDKLIFDDFAENIEDEQDMQDEIIESMLEDTRFDILPRDLFGFRENGRVFVFNKSN